MGPGYGISKKLGIKPEPNEYTGILVFFVLLFLVLVTAPYWSKHFNLKIEQNPRQQKETPRGKYYMPKPHANASGLRSFLMPFK